MTQSIDHTLDQLIQDFGNFKSRQDKRLEALERKSLTDRRPMTDRTQLHDAGFRTYIVQGIQHKALSTDPNRGGVVIPELLQTAIRSKIDDLSPLRRLASTLTISTSRVDVLVNKKNGDAGWVDEAGDRDETAAPEIAKVTIPVHELYAKPRATQKLLDDAAINIEEWLVGRIAERMARLETQAFLFGDGEAKPKGILSYELTTDGDHGWGKLQTILTGADGAFEDENGGDILIDAFQSLEAKYLEGAVWLMSRSAMAAVRKLKDPATGAYLWQPALGDRASTLLGSPVIVSDDMPAVTPGTPSNGILFGNFKDAYQIVDRQDVHVLRDPYSSKPYVEFYVTKRLGGDVINFEALKVVRFEKKTVEAQEE